MPSNTVLIDCEAGRRMGCASFCCRLIVRLSPSERDPGSPDDPGKHCLDKDTRDGLCVYFERDTGRCGIWERRPRTCREYECNSDPLLQVVLREGYSSLVRLAFASDRPASPRAQVPLLQQEPCAPDAARNEADTPDDLG